MLALLIAAALAAAGVPVLVVEGPPALELVVERVRAFDPARLERALAIAGLEMPPSIEVTLVAEDDPRAAGVPRWTVGRAWGDREIEIFPARTSPYADDSIESVLRHEIVHLALDRRAGGAALPRWFHEGVAEAIGSERGLIEQWQLVRAVVTVPTLDEVDRQFASDRQGPTADAYRLAAALLDDVRKRHGTAVLGAIAGRVADGTRFDQAFLAETGETAEEAATRAWGVYRRASQWLAVLSSSQVLWTAILLLAFAAMVVRLRRRAQLRRFWDELDGER
jgi:hypothetical protein